MTVLEVRAGSLIISYTVVTTAYSITLVEALVDNGSVLDLEQTLLALSGTFTALSVVSTAPTADAPAGEAPAASRTWVVPVVVVVVVLAVLIVVVVVRRRNRSEPTAELKAERKMEQELIVTETRFRLQEALPIQQD